MRRSAAVLALTCSSLALVSGIARAQLPSAVARAMQGIQPAALRAHMSVLSDDSLAGRRTATRGYDLGAAYVTRQLRAAGLRPGAGHGWHQPVPLYRSDPQEAGTELELLGPGDQRLPLVTGRDFVLDGDFRSGADVEAGVVFVGYGITAPELGHDDYAGLDVRGRIVAILSGAPTEFGREARSWYAETKLRNAAAHGASGALWLWGPIDGPATAWESVARALGATFTPAFGPADSTGVGDASPFGAVWLSPTASAALFTGAPLSYEQASASAQPAVLPGSVRIARRNAVSRVQSSNIIGLLPGSDPRLRHQYVVISAHLDHLGVGTPVDGDSIYNGAVDDASGIATLLELARTFAALPERPRRSLLFVAFTGEEPGNLGSGYFVRHPPVPLDSIVADINIDGASMWAFDGLIPRGAEHSTMGRVIDSAAVLAGTRVVANPFPDRASLAGSDQYSFLTRGIPSAIVGTLRTDAARPLVLDWVRRRYHAPSDDMAQPLDFDAAAQYARDLFVIVHAIAAESERPRWLPGDFYGERFGSPVTRAP